MHLRSATVSDLTSIEELLRVCSLPTAGIAEHLTHFIVADDSRGLLACGGIEYYERYALIRSIAVAERARSAGLGKAIVSRLLAECRTRAVQSIGLLTTTAEDYFAAQGFVSVARSDVPDALLASSQFQGVCPGSATAMLMAY